jgi:hypothetical protein
MGVVRLTIRKYRTVDLLIFTAIACILDFVIGRFGLFGGRQYFGLSTTFVLVLYVRWGKAALLPNLVVALVNAAVNYIDFGVAAAHAAGILALSVALLLIRWKPLRERRPGLAPATVYYLACYLALFLTEYLLLALFGRGLAFVDYAVNRVFDVLIGWGLLLLVVAQKEILVPMNLYIKENSEGNGHV